MDSRTRKGSPTAIVGTDCTSGSDVVNARPLRIDLHRQERHPATGIPTRPLRAGAPKTEPVEIRNSDLNLEDWPHLHIHSHSVSHTA
jgi:hypothetical protein